MLAEHDLTRDGPHQVAEIGGQVDQQVVHGHHPHELTATDHGQASNPVRTKEREGIVEVAVGVDRDRRRRHHGVDPGVISHATNIVEHPELVCERIVRLAKLVGRENIIAGTDCGFAQSPMYRRVHPSIMWAKLEALAAGAQLASMELWG